MFLFITEARSIAERNVRDVVSPTVNRPESELRQRLLIGSAGECAEKLAAFRDVGAQRVFLWPVNDELHQLEAFQEQLHPLLGS